MSMLFDPATLPPRDADGSIWHPDLDERFQHDEMEEYLDPDKFRAHGLEYRFTSFEYDAAPELIADWEETGYANLAAWNPSAPEGNDWRMVAIYDTEDGAVALFVRDIAQGGVQ